MPTAAHQSDSLLDFKFQTLLPNYRLFGNRMSVRSNITMSAYEFCRFRYNTTYMSALAVPEEKMTLLVDILP
jgi:hypothetical protein